MPTKRTIEQINQLLQAAGVEAVEVVEDPTQADEFVLDNELSAIDQARTAILKPRIEQELQESVDKKSSGKSNGILITALVRAYGNIANRKELESMEKQDDMIKHCIEKYNETLNKDTEGLRSELSNLANKHAQEIDSIKDQHQSELSSQKEKYNSRNVHSLYTQTIAAKPRIDGDDSVRAEGFSGYVSNRAHVVYDEEKHAIRLFEKNNPEIPLQNEKRTQDITLDMLEEEYAQKQGYRVKDTRHVDAAKQMGQMPPNAPSTLANDLSSDPVNSMVNEAASWGA